MTIRTTESIQVHERVRPVRADRRPQPAPAGRTSRWRRFADLLSGGAHGGIVRVTGVPDRDWPAHRAI